MTVAGSIVTVYGTCSPAVVVDYVGPTFDGDSGFIVCLADFPSADVVTMDDITPWHLACLLEEHPTVGRGMDACLASETKCVQLDEEIGDWVPFDPPA